MARGTLAQISPGYGGSSFEAQLTGPSSTTEFGLNDSPAWLPDTRVVGPMAQHAGPLKQFGLARRFRKEAETAITLDPRRFDAQDGLMMFFLKVPGVTDDAASVEQAVRKSTTAPPEFVPIVFELCSEAAAADWQAISATGP